MSRLFIFRGILLVGILPRNILLRGIFLWRDFAGGIFLWRDLERGIFQRRFFWLEGFSTPAKNWIFDDLFHKKGLVLIIWLVRMINPSLICLMKWGCRCHWGHWGCWGHWGHWGCRGFNGWKITAEDFRVIQSFELALFLCFEKKNFG